MQGRRAEKGEQAVGIDIGPGLAAQAGSLGLDKFPQVHQVGHVRLFEEADEHRGVRLQALASLWALPLRFRSLPLRRLIIVIGQQARLLGTRDRPADTGGHRTPGLESVFYQRPARHLAPPQLLEHAHGQHRHATGVVLARTVELVLHGVERFRHGGQEIIQAYAHVNLGIFR